MNMSWAPPIDDWPRLSAGAGSVVKGVICRISYHQGAQGRVGRDRRQALEGQARVRGRLEPRRVRRVHGTPARRSVPTVQPLGRLRVVRDGRVPVLQRSRREPDYGCERELDT